jgi:GNAT superfamily N-acetyltransferase
MKHPELLDQSQADGTLIVRAVTQDDLSGHGNPSPAYCTELQFGSQGNPETVGLLAGWIGRYSCAMFGAYIRRQAAGFITFAPREELWKLGWFEEVYDPPVPGEREEVLTVLCLHVYPGARQRGVATALVSIPNRYMHTPVELISLKDVEKAVELITETIMRITPEMDFSPLQ